MPDFKRLKKIPIVDVCLMLGIDLKPRGKQYRAYCPICDHPSERAFVVTPAIERYWCFGYCRSGGDGLELYARMRQLTKKNAARELIKHFNPP